MGHVADYMTPLGDVVDHLELSKALPRPTRLEVVREGRYLDGINRIFRICFSNSDHVHL
jgi:hypothetical protein